MEVMGLMLGDFVDDYTVRCIDVFAMPQTGTAVSVETVDPVFQTKMLDMLKQTGRCVFLPGEEVQCHSLTSCGRAFWSDMSSHSQFHHVPLILLLRSTAHTTRALQT